MNPIEELKIKSDVIAVKARPVLPGDLGVERTRTRAARLLVLAAAAVAAMLAHASPAFALNTHLLAGSFGERGLGTGQLELAFNSGIAIDDATHDVYVADTGNRRVDEFEANGTFVRAFGKDVGGLGVDVCGGLVACQPGAEGSGPGEFTKPTFLAVDNSTGASKGDVYVGDPGDSLVSKFTGAGALIESWGVKGQLDGSAATAPPGVHAGPFAELAGVAVGATGTLDVFETEPHILFSFTEEGAFVTDFETPRGTTPAGLAVDAEGNLFKVNGSGVEEIASSGSEHGEVNLGLATGTGLAVNALTGELYIDGGATIEHFAFSSPGVVSEQSGSPCTVIPEPEERGCPATDTFGEGDLSGGAGLGVDPASNDVYVANTTAGKIDVFTPALLPDVATGAATNIADTTATIAGTVNPDATATTYQFEYGTSTAYGSVSPLTAANVGSDSSTHALSANLTALAPDTTYHYRIVATNANGTNRGRDMAFRTTGPPTIDAQSATDITNTTATIDGEINPGGFDTHYRVEYGPTATYGSSSPATDIGAESSDQSTSAGLVGLQPETTYHYRVVASNSQGAPVDGPDEVFATLAAAPIEAEAVSNLGSSEVTVSAKIDALGGVTTYDVEYGTSDSYGSSTTVESLGASDAAVEVQQRLVGVQAGLEYHFRFVATNGAGTTYGADTSFTTPLATEASATGLPDDRQYELVSGAAEPGETYVPAGASGRTEDIETVLLFQAASSGERVAYVSDPSEEASANGTPGKGAGNTFLAVRTKTGWEPHDITPPGNPAENATVAEKNLFEAFSPELTSTILASQSSVVAASASPQGPAECSGILEETLPDGSRASVLPASIPARGCGLPLFAGAAGGETLFQSEAALTAFSTPTLGVDANEKCIRTCNIYVAAGGQMHSVNVLPHGEGRAAGTVGGPDGQGQPSAFEGALSSDGRLVYWTAEDEPHAGRIYVTENPTASPSPLSATGECLDPDDACTFAVSAGAAKFWMATPDGRYAYYTEGGALWRYDSAAASATRITATSAEVEGLLGMNSVGEDGAFVYIVAYAKLAGNTNSHDEGAVEGEPNVYLLHGASPTFIATLANGDDGLSGGALGAAGGRQFGDWQAFIGGRTSEVTPDGESLVLESRRPLTGYDNTLEGEHAEQVFVYDAETDRLDCVSCQQNGAPEHETRGELQGAGATYLPYSWSTTVMHRWISDDGAQVFFDTSQPLVPSDTNGVQDVYEWEREGQASCPVAVPARLDGGCVFLLSGGDSSDFSFLVDISASGDDVFITHRGPLGEVGPKDDKAHLYDVRVDGGFPQTSLACEGTGCQGVPPAPPQFAAPPSATFSGTGNFPPPAPLTPKPKPLTRAQQLAKALKACRKLRAKHPRAACEKRARKRYAVVKQKPRKAPPKVNDDRRAK